jgi:hypothetical protein
MNLKIIINNQVRAIKESDERAEKLIFQFLVGKRSELFGRNLAFLY